MALSRARNRLHPSRSLYGWIPRQSRRPSQEEFAKVEVVKWLPTLVFLPALAATLQAQAPASLTIERLTFHQYEDGPVLPTSYEFLPGEVVWLSCRIGGFRVERKDDEQRVKLAWQLRAVDPEDVLLEKPKSGEIADRLLPEDKEWRPKFLASFIVPGFAIGGTYKIPIIVRDEFASTEITKTLEFQVRGPEPPKAAALGIRNFRFLRNENDAVALTDAAYRPGTMLWAKFDIIGFKLGENNRLDVNYGLAVLDAEGKELFAQPEAAGDAKESFYPQRWVPGTLSLTLDPNVRAAGYILRVIVRDKLAGTTEDYRQPFRVQ